MGALPPLEKKETPEGSLRDRMLKLIPDSSVTTPGQKVDTDLDGK